MIEQDEFPRPPAPDDESATERSAHPVEPAEGAREPGEDPAPERPAQLIEPAEGQR